MHLMPTVVALSDTRIVAAYVIFLASYVVFALGKFPGLKIDRPGAAIIGGHWVSGSSVGRPYPLDFVICENSADPNVPVAGKLTSYA